MVACVFHAFVFVGANDDADFARVLDNKNIFEWLYSRYQVWSSRFFIEFFMVIIVRYPLLWKLIDIGAYMLTAFSLSYLIPFKQDERFKNFVIACLILWYPMGDMSSAGWVATSTGYFWTIAAGSYALTAVIKTLKGTKLKWYEIILYVFATLYAANHEQMACCMIAFMVCILIYCICSKRRIHAFTWIQLVLACVDFGLILLAPGNAKRKLQVIKKMMPDFESISFVDKAYMAYSDTMNYYIIGFNIVLFVFAVLLLWGVVKKYKSIVARGIVLFPVAYLLLVQLWPFDRLGFLFAKQEVIDVLNVTNTRLYIPLLISVFLLGCLIAGMYLIYENSIHFWINLMVLGVGMVSRIAMGFSGSLYASYNRTLIFFTFAVIFAVIYLICFLYGKLNAKILEVGIATITVYQAGYYLYLLIHYAGTIPKYY